MKILGISRILAALALAVTLVLVQTSIANVFAAVQPTITTIDPNSGPGSGGTEVTITGTGFASSTTVKIGSLTASSTVMSSTTILVTTPFGAGPEDVIVSNGDGTFATSTNGFTYPDLPTLSSISVTTPANKLSYHVGDTLDLTGLVVTGTYNNGSTGTVPISQSNVTGFDSTNAVSGQELTITSGSSTAKYSIDILPVPLSLTTTTNSDGSVSGTISGATNASAEKNGVTVTLSIPADTIITGTSSWDGTFALPSATTSFILSPSSGKTATATIAVEVGAGDIALSLSDPAKIAFVGQAGKLAGWSQNGIFTPITTTCDSTSTPSLATSTGSGNKDCKIDIGSDLIVWTTHLSIFIAYTESSTVTPSPAPSPSPSPTPSTSGGNGAPIGLIGFPTQTQTTPPPTPTPTPTPPSGQVLGASTYNFTTRLAFGSRGEAVTALQNALTAQGMYSGPITGYFGMLTQAAVKAFQSAHGISPIGIVGPQTRAALNSLGGNNGMTDSARQTLIALLMEKLQQLYAQIAALQASSTATSTASTASASSTSATSTPTASSTSTNMTTASSTTASTTTM